MWENIVRTAGQTTVTMWRMRFACWVIKATDTPTDYVIRFTFPPKQYLNERASLLL